MLAKIVQFIPTGLFFLLSAAICSTAYISQWQTIVLVLASLLIATCVFLCPLISGVLLGVALCVMPVIGGYSLSILVSVFLFAAYLKDAIACREGRLSDIESLGSCGILLFILGVLSAGFYSLGFALDFGLLLSLYDHGGLASLLDYWSTRFNSAEIETLRYASSFALSLFLFRQLCRWQQNYHFLSFVVTGLMLGAGIVVLFLVGQVFELHPIFSVTRSSFWIYTNRYSASFSDPNAFGLMAGFLLSVLFFATPNSVRKFALALGVAMAIAALWSGSRTFWLIVGCCLLFLFSRKVKRNSLLVAGLTLGFIVAIGFILGAPPINRFVTQNFALPSLIRLASSLHWDNFSNLFASRTVFWQMAIYLWSLAPFFGNGLGSFYSGQVTAAQILNLELGEWRDNANNFYLQLLAENGLVGLFLVLASFFLLFKSLSSVCFETASSYQRRKLELCRVSCLILVLLFVIGPHLNFSELRYLFCILLALGLGGQIANKKIYRLPKIFLFVCVFLFPLSYAIAFMVTTNPARGVYDLEQYQDRDFRWTLDSAQFSVCNAKIASQSSISIAAPRPDLPIQVLAFVYENGELRKFSTISVGNTEEVEIILPASVSDEQRVWLKVDKLWQPSAGSSGGDRRWLGVQVYWRENFCE